MKYVTPTLMGAFILYALVIATGYIVRSHVPFLPYAGGADQDAAVPDEERVRQHHLEARSAEAVKRATVKEQVGTALVARSITLTEAAARFRALQQASPNAARDGVGAEVPPSANSDGERYCRMVIKYIRNYWDNEPTTPAVVAHLESELKTLLQDGEILLPEWNEE